MKTLYQIATVGFFLSLFTHAATFQDMNLQQDVPIVWALHFGIFLVWIPTVMMVWGYVRALGWREFKKWMLNRIPTWMKIGSFILFIYGMGNFLYNFYELNEGGVPTKTNGQYMLKSRRQVIRKLSRSEYDYHQTITVRSFSGQWMTFYFLSMAVLHAVTKTQEQRS